MSRPIPEDVEKELLAWNGGKKYRSLIDVYTAVIEMYKEKGNEEKLAWAEGEVKRIINTARPKPKGVKQ